MWSNFGCVLSSLRSLPNLYVTLIGPKFLPKVSVLPHKAERREGTCKFVCPVPSCNFRKEGSRVFIAKHFRVVHKDYRQGYISCMFPHLKTL